MVELSKNSTGITEIMEKNRLTDTNNKLIGLKIQHKGGYNYCVIAASLYVAEMATQLCRIICYSWEIHIFYYKVRRRIKGSAKKVKQLYLINSFNQNDG